MKALSPAPEVMRRTFEANQHPKDSAERARLNNCALTSEYMPSHHYLVRHPYLMSDGTPHPQGYLDQTCKTKAEAIAKATQ